MSLKKPTGQCARCGSTENLTRDHIIPKVMLKPLCVMEINHGENIQVLCLNCNKLKAHALDPKNPKTMPLLRKYVDRYEKLYVTKVSRRKYVWRTLEVKSLTPEPTYLHAMSRKEVLKNIYWKQTRYVKV